jgi:ADP-dependent NAD(P)H-hydrate dehydratase
LSRRGDSLVSKGKRSGSKDIESRPTLITRSFLHKWPLPEPDKGGDKEERGRVLIIGGAEEMPGAVILAATAAFRAGAGKVQIATARSIAPFVAAAVPETRVFGLPETKAGGIATSVYTQLAEYANVAKAVLIGPGMVDANSVTRLLERLLPHLNNPTLIIDAIALKFLAKSPQSISDLSVDTVITPHAREMAEIVGMDEVSIARDPLAVALQTASQFRSVTVLKGAETYITTPDGASYINRTGNVGLATSGSGDTLSGVIAGLVARGAIPHQAAAWAVYLHGCAGDRLARRIGKLGYLASELLIEIPKVMSTI